MKTICHRIHTHTHTQFLLVDINFLNASSYRFIKYTRGKIGETMFEYEINWK